MNNEDFRARAWVITKCVIATVVGFAGGQAQVQLQVIADLRFGADPQAVAEAISVACVFNPKVLDPPAKVAREGDPVEPALLSFVGRCRTRNRRS